jgi:hypothetical protein
MCINVGSIEWHQKTYHEISWDYPFKPNKKEPAKGISAKPEIRVTRNICGILLAHFWNIYKSIYTVQYLL